MREVVSAAFKGLLSFKSDKSSNRAFDSFLLVGNKVIDLLVDSSKFLELALGNDVTTIQKESDHFFVVVGERNVSNLDLFFFDNNGQLLEAINNLVLQQLVESCDGATHFFHAWCGLCGSHFLNTAHAKEVVLPHLLGNRHLSREIRSSQGGKIPQLEVKLGSVSEVEHLETVAHHAEETNADDGEAHVALGINLLFILEAGVLSIPLSGVLSAEIVSSLV